MQLASGEVGRRLDIGSLSKPSNHRSVYLPILRGLVPEMLNVFDMADPNLVVGQRDMTTVATQALYMMNSPFVLEQAEKMGRLLLTHNDGDEPARIKMAYERALSRPPTTQERQRAASYLRDYSASVAADGVSAADAELAAWTSFCQTLLSSAEFRYVY
jgi:hypothetical protein